MTRAIGGALAVLAVLGAAAALCRLTSVDCRLCALPGLDCETTAVQRGFRQEVVVGGLEFPTSFAFLPDGRIVVAEKDGRVRVVERDRLRDRPLLDLRARVDTYSLRGLLAVEPDPRFRRNGWLYVLYARGAGSDGRPTTMRLERFTVHGDRAADESARAILGRVARGSCNARPSGADCIPADGDQVGGDIAFARDGTMYVTTGDGSREEDRRNSLRAQQLDSLAGKVLHVTRDGRGIPRNPFWDGSADDARSKVWAYGFRNPFRMTLRPPSGALYVGDVGWNTTDEIDAVTRGGNFGWPCYEGETRPREYARFRVCAALHAKGDRATRRPVFAHAVQIDPRRSSVTGGVFYTGRAYPVQYRGAYFFGDWARNTIEYLRPLRAGLAGPPHDFAEEANGPVELAVGPDGDLYYLASKVGELRRIVYAMRS